MHYAHNDGQLSHVLKLLYLPTAHLQSGAVSAVILHVKHFRGVNEHVLH